MSDMLLAYRTFACAISGRLSYSISLRIVDQRLLEVDLPPRLLLDLVLRFVGAFPVDFDARVFLAADFFVALPADFLAALPVDFFAAAFFVALDAPRFSNPLLFLTGAFALRGSSGE